MQKRNLNIKDQIDVVTNLLPKAISSNLKPTPLEIYLLYTSRDYILAALEEAEAKAIQSQNKIKNGMDEEENHDRA